MPPRRSTPRKGRAESADPAPATEAAADSPVTTPRRTTRGRRATTKAAAAEESVPPVPKPKTKSTTRARATKAGKEAVTKAEKEADPKTEKEADPKTEEADPKTEEADPKTEEADPKTEKETDTLKNEPDAEAEALAESATLFERMHKLPTRTNPRLGEVKSRQVKLQVIRREDKYVLLLTRQGDYYWAHQAPHREWRRAWFLAKAVRVCD